MLTPQELYHALTFVLPRGVSIGSERVKVIPDSAAVNLSRVDYFLNSQFRWALELMAHGTEKERRSHALRFTNGKYDKYDVRKYAVIDFHSPPRAGQKVVALGGGAEPDRETITVVFNDRFRSAQLFVGEVHEHSTPVTVVPLSP